MSEHTEREMEVAVITHDFYKAQEIIEYLEEPGEIAVRGIFRTYHADSLFEQDPPDLVISSGTCKTRDEDGKSIGVYYNARQKAKELGIAHLPMFLPNSLLALGVRVTKSRRGL